MGLCCLNTPRVSESQAERAAQRCLLSRAGGEAAFHTDVCKGVSDQHQGICLNRDNCIKRVLFCHGALNPLFSLYFWMIGGGGRPPAGKTQVLTQSSCCFSRPKRAVFSPDTLQHVHICTQAMGMTTQVCSHSCQLNRRFGDETC